MNKDNNHGQTPPPANWHPQSVPPGQGPPQQPPYGQYPPPPKPSKKNSIAILIIALAAIMIFGICFFGMLIAIAVPNFLEAQARSKVSRVRADMRSMAVALEAYFVDNNEYPPSYLSEEDPYLSRFANGALTTPIAFTSHYFSDIWAPVSGDTYRYQTLDNWWIIWSPGPDRQYDLKPLNEPFYPSAQTPVPAHVINLTYDPTNGTVSSGDIWRVQQ